jgi:hypothetical protein
LLKLYKTGQYHVRIINNNIRLDNNMSKRNRIGASKKRSLSVGGGYCLLHHENITDTQQEMKTPDTNKIIGQYEISYLTSRHDGKSDLCLGK